MNVDWTLLSAIAVFVYGIALGVYLIYLRKKKTKGKDCLNLP